MIVVFPLEMDSDGDIDSWPHQFELMAAACDRSPRDPSLQNEKGFGGSGQTFRWAGCPACDFEGWLGSTTIREHDSDGPWIWEWTRSAGRYPETTAPWHPTVDGVGGQSCETKNAAILWQCLDWSSTSGCLNECSVNSKWILSRSGRQFLSLAAQSFSRVPEGGELQRSGSMDWRGSLMTFLLAIAQDQGPQQCPPEWIGRFRCWMKGHVLVEHF